MDATYGQRRQEFKGRSNAYAALSYFLSPGPAWIKDPGLTG